MLNINKSKIYTHLNIKYMYVSELPLNNYLIFG